MIKTASESRGGVHWLSEMVFTEQVRQWADIWRCHAFYYLHHYRRKLALWHSQMAYWRLSESIFGRQHLVKLECLSWKLWKLCYTGHLLYISDPASQSCDLFQILLQSQVSYRFLPDSSRYKVALHLRPILNCFLSQEFSVIIVWDGMSIGIVKKSSTTQKSCLTISKWEPKGCPYFSE